MKITVVILFIRVFVREYMGGYWAWGCLFLGEYVVVWINFNFWGSCSMIWVI